MNIIYTIANNIEIGVMDIDIFHNLSPLLSYRHKANIQEKIGLYSICHDWWSTPL